MKFLSLREACYNLASFLKNEEGVVFCVGTRLRGDDVACLRLCESIHHAFPHLIELCEFGLENCPVFDILERRRITNIIVCDTMFDPEISAGSIIEMTMDDIRLQQAFHLTHSIPQFMMLKRIKEAYPSLNIKIFAINTHSLDVSLQASREIDSLIRDLARCILEISMLS